MESTPVALRERYVLTKYDVADDGARTVAEVVTLEYEHGKLIRKSVDRPAEQEASTCRY